MLREIRATKLIATHDLEFVVEMCPRSVVLDRGRIVADGPTLELLNDEPLMLAHGLERPHVLDHRVDVAELPDGFKITVFKATQ